MSRRAKHQRIPSHLVSDYESDVAPAPPPPRTNTELNLSVLRRYNPTIVSILSIAANAVVYHFGASSWDKSGVEGTMFVCQQTSGYSLVILNRRGLENVIVNLADVGNVEVTTELLILQLSDRVMGIWIHADKEGAREVNYHLVKECWEAVRV